jgi:hypothetical protein
MPQQPTFLLRFPCFTIQNTAGTGPVVQTFDRGDVAMVLLDDEDLVTRFREEHGLGGDTIQFNDKGHLAAYLSTLPPVITAVAFDPGSRAAFLLPVNAVIQQCCGRAR